MTLTNTLKMPKNVETSQKWVLGWARSTGCWEYPVDTHSSCFFVLCRDKTQWNELWESNRNLFPSTRGQRSIFKMFILTFWKKVSECSILASCSVKNHYIFSKSTFFCCSVFTKMTQLPLFFCVVESVNVYKRTKFWLI